jgi:hypothetical protein
MITRFTNKTGNNDVTMALITAHVLLTDGSKMINEIRVKNDFKYGSGRGALVASRLLDQRLPIEVFMYRPWNPWTAAVGYFDGEAIHVNSRKVGSFNLVDIVGLLLHEYGHYCGFYHGNNYKTQEKCLFSVNYFMSENVGKWV